MTQISQWNDQTQANIFTYSLGGDADGICRQISCAANSLFTPVKDSDDLATTLLNFLPFLAATLNNTQPAWTDTYTDHGGLGKVISVA